MQNINRIIKPPIVSIKEPEFIKPVNLKLDNDISFHAIDSGDMGAVKLEIIIKAGSHYSQKNLVSKFTAGLIKEGTENYNSDKIAEILDYYGAYLDISNSKDAIYVKLLSLKKYLPVVLPIIAEIIWSPKFPEDEINIYKTNSKQQFVINEEKVRIIAKRHFFSLIFGEDHPYGKIIKATDFDAIIRDDLVQFYNKHYHPENCKIILTGGFDDEILKLINKYFGQHKGVKITHDTYDFNVKIKPNNKIIKKKNAIQSALRIGKPMFNKKHPDYLKLKIFNTIFGGYFGSRLMTNIREEKGYTYGIGSGLVSLYNSGYFFIASEVGSKVTKKALNEIYIELDKLQQHKVPAEELILVKNYLIGDILRQLDGMFSLAEAYKNLLEFDLGIDYFSNYFNILHEITSEELLLLGQKYFEKESLFELVVGKK